VTSRGTFLAALRGQEVVAFSASVWWRLPGFLNSEERPGWWLDPGYCTRALAEVATLCGLQAIQVPLLRSPDVDSSGGLSASAAEPYEVLAARPDVQAALTIVDQLVRQDRHAVLGVLPAVSDMRGRWPNESREEFEDDTSDVVSRLFGLGADGVIIQGAEATEVQGTMNHIARLAIHFGRVVLGVTPRDAWSTDGQHVVVSVLPQAPWPTIHRGALLATADLSTYSPRELRTWLVARPRVN
jgi:hypothetical protein